MSTFQIAAVQSTPVFMEREATVDKTCELIAEAAQDDDVRLVVFPEAFIPTYPDWVWRIPPGEHQMLAEEGQGGTRRDTGFGAELTAGTREARFEQVAAGSNKE